VRVSYRDTAGTQWNNRIVGRIWILHNWYWPYATGTVINATASRPNPYGSGQINYIPWVSVGVVYPGSGGCSGGPHTHIEFYSTHNYGLAYEWRSPNGPDFFNCCPYSHVHWSNSNWDAVTAGSHILGYLGGDSTAWYMNDNPYSSYH